ncbi:MAG: GNVR domain-containing protein [Cyclobacteriaceae bacterium]
MMVDQPTSNTVEEIDFRELLVLFKSKKGFILRFTLLAAAIGLFIAITSRVEYTASSKLLPESNAQGGLNMAGLGGLAGLAGISLDGSQTGMMSPEVYPEIVNSLPFLIEASNVPVYFSEPEKMYSSFHYFDQVQTLSLGEFVLKYTIGLPGMIFEFFTEPTSTLEDESLLTSKVLNRRARGILDSFSKRIILDTDINTGIISLKVEMPDPYAAAELAEKVTELLINRITRYRIEKAEVNLVFIEERYKESKADYENRLEGLAEYTDRNVNVVSSVAQIEIQRLQNEVDVRFGVYKELATQLENAKIKVKEQTPVLTILEPAAVPVEKSSPKRLIILISSALLGMLMAVSIVLFRYLFRFNS